MAITTPDAVPGEVIEAAWGDAVRADLTAHEAALATKMPIAGGVFTGSVAVQAFPDAATPTHGIGLYASTGAIACVVPAASATTTPNVNIGRGGSPAANTGGQYIRFARGTDALIGSITIASATSVAYNTTSDPRTKTPPTQTRGIDDAAARVQQIGANAWRGVHIDSATGEPEADSETWDFISSHDVEDVAPYAVYGERDAVDAEGVPVWQQVSYGDLVPLLFAALANALDRIDALEGAAT